MKTIQTPWGRSDHCREVGDGILFAETSSHGGFYVPLALYNTMPQALRCNVYGGGTWFEEDVEWTLVVLAFPQFFTREEIQTAEHTIRFYKGRDPYSQAAAWLESHRQLAA